MRAVPRRWGADCSASAPILCGWSPRRCPWRRFPASLKRAAVLGFVQADSEEVEYADRAGYLKYIKGQRKRLFPLALETPPLLALMLREKLLPKADVPVFLDQARQAVTALEAYGKGLGEKG